MSVDKLDDIEKAFSLDQVSIRLVKDGTLLSDKPLNSPEAVVETLGAMMSEFDREVVGIINFQADMKPINIHFASVGSLNEAMAHPREIMKAAILSNAENMMLLHCHPSGNLQPSKTDTALTDRMSKACELMGIPLTDHIIVGGDNKNFFSFREKSIMPMSALKFTRDLDKLDLGKVAEKEDAYQDASFLHEGNRTEKKSSVEKITEQLEQGLRDLFDSEKYQNYLKTMSKFHNYSFNNTLLIAMQKPEATMVAGYTSWVKNFKRHVKKGEKGIKIFAPAPYKKKAERDVLDPNTNQPVLDENGNRKKEEVEITIPAFKVVTVFDAAQTEGEPIPSLGVDELTAGVENYQDFIKAVELTAPVPMEYAKIEGGAKGYFSPGEKKIVINVDMSESQTAKTAIHELAHSMLHDKDNILVDGIEKKEKDRNTKEVEAESIAFTVCQHFSIDTSDYSFGYVAGWSSGKELEELRESMETIRKTADLIITNVEEQMGRLQREREEVQSEKKEAVVVTFFVAECTEFHGLGEFHENLETVEDAIKAFDDIPEKRLNGIKALGIRVAPLSNPDDYTEFDVITGKNVDLDMLSYYPEVKNEEKVQDMIAQILYEMPNIEVRGVMPDVIREKLNTLREPDMSEAEKLAVRVDTFAKDSDPYGYSDNVQDVEANIRMLASDIENGEAEYLVDFLMPFAEGEGLEEEAIEAKDILVELKKLCPEMDIGVKEENTYNASYQSEYDRKDRTEIINMFRSKTEEAFHELDGENAESIEKMVKSRIEDAIVTFDLDAKVLDVVLVGSRARGIEQEDSDVDIVVEYYGSEKEDVLFNILNEEGISIGGKNIDINPITRDKSGGLETYLPEAESYLHQKATELMPDLLIKEQAREDQDLAKEKVNEQKQYPEGARIGKYGNFTMQKKAESENYYLFADIKYPSGEIEKQKPIAKFDNLIAVEDFCKKNNIVCEDITGNIENVIKKKKKISNEKSNPSKSQVKDRNGALEE